MLVGSSTAAHAGGAYVVDDAAIGKPGECQVEMWVSHAGNGDFVGVIQPACVVRIGLPIELTAVAQVARSHEWTTFAGLQAKVVPISLEVSRVAIALSAGALFDTTNGDATISYVNVPVTIKVSDQFRLNLNAGALRNGELHFTWGTGLEWDVRPSWTLIAEVFGQTGLGEDPRLQAGLRHSPTKAVDVDVIYGQNITGEGAHWITAGLTVRF